LFHFHLSYFLATIICLSVIPILSLQSFKDYQGKSFLYIPKSTITGFDSAYYQTCIHPFPSLSRLSLQVLWLFP